MLKGIKIWVILVVLCSQGTSCNQPKEVNKESVISAVDSLIYDRRDIKYRLPNSDYFFNISIDSILILDLKENFFTVRADAYSRPESRNGINIGIKFTISNPYENEILTAIPDHFTLMSTEKFSTDIAFNGIMYYTNSIKIEDKNGKGLWEISDEICGKATHNYCIYIKPNEQKEFVVKFKEPIIEGIGDLIFIGFSLKWDNPKFTRKKDVGFIIDPIERVFKGEKRF